MQIARCDLKYTTDGKHTAGCYFSLRIEPETIVTRNGFLYFYVLVSHVLLQTAEQLLGAGAGGWGQGNENKR